MRSGPQRAAVMSGPGNAAAEGRYFWVPVAIAVFALAAMVSVAAAANLPIRDPDARYVGSPLALIGVIALIFLVLDVIPRGWRARADGGFARGVGAVLRDRWLGRRGLVVVACLLSFYATYLSYRNLKSFLPFVTDANFDPALLEVERAVFFGSDPARILHDLLGTGVAAHFLSFVYLAFLTFVPLSLGAALIWSNRLDAGIWYVAALSLNWLLGAVSYYVLPALGPIYHAPSLFYSLPETGVTRLQENLLAFRAEVLADPFASSAVQSIAAFASLHTAVLFTAALIAHLLGLPRALRVGLWAFLGLTMVATVYFGWHYVVDDVAGLGIGLFAVWAAARMTGFAWQPFPRGTRPQSSASAT